MPILIEDVVPGLYEFPGTASEDPVLVVATNYIYSTGCYAITWGWLNSKKHRVLVWMVSTNPVGTIFFDDRWVRRITDG